MAGQHHTIVKNNPASRLHAFLEPLMTEVNKNVNSKDVFARIWGIGSGAKAQNQSNDIARLWALTSKVIALIPQTELLIRAHSVFEPEAYLQWVPNVQRAFDQLHLAGALSTFVAPIQQADLNQLKMCAYELQKIAPEHVADSERLAELTADAYHFIDALNASSIDERFRSYLIRQLRLIIDAISDYNLQGIARLNDEIDRLVGSMWANRAEFEKHQNSVETKRFWEMLERFSNILQVADYGWKLLGSATTSVMQMFQA